MEKYNIYLSHYTQHQGQEHNKVIIIINDYYDYHGS